MINLTLLHTNDIHGRVTQLTQIASLVRTIRQEVEAAGGYCLFVDAGDSEDTTLLESSLTKGSAMEAILRGAGCEFAALGNAIPLRYGHEAISDLAKHFGRPLLCANMSDENGRLVEGLEPYAITTFGSLKVGILGLTDTFLGYTSFFKLKMDQPADVLPGLITNARTEGAKTIVLLSHLGSNKDVLLPEEIDGIDVIIGAHDHKEINPPLVVRDTIITQAGDFGRLLGRLDLTLDPVTGKVIHHEGTLIPITEEIPPDPITQQTVEAERARAHQVMNHEIGILEAQFEHSVERECAVGNLLVDALLKRVEGAQIAFVLDHWENGLESGPLTRGALFSANRSTANPAKAELTGEQILQFLREALKLENSSRQLRQLRGRPIGLPHVGGAQVRYSENLEEIEVKINEETLKPTQKYIVASTDMEFADFVGYLVIPFEQVEYEVPIIMPEVLEQYIARHSPLGKPKGNRIIRKIE